MLKQRYRVPRPRNGSSPEKFDVTKQMLRRPFAGRRAGLEAELSVRFGRFAKFLNPVMFAAYRNTQFAVILVGCD